MWCIAGGSKGEMEREQEGAREREQAGAVSEGTDHCSREATRSRVAVGFSVLTVLHGRHL